MPKKKKIIIVGEQEYPLDAVVTTLSLAQLSELLAEERKITIENCTGQLRPFVTGDVGRVRLEELDLTISDNLIVVEEPVDTAAIVFVDRVRSEVIENVDFGHIIQTIRRPF